MAVRDILLQLTSYPTRTPQPVIGAAVGVASLLDARISAAVCKVETPNPANFVTRTLTDISAVLAESNATSAAAAEAMAAEFRAAADQSGRPDSDRPGEVHVLHCRGSVQTPELVAQARLHDLTIMPIADDIAIQFAAQDLIFGSGRPVLLLPADTMAAPVLDTVVVGWDASRAASRAVADALPFLKIARAVRLVEIRGEKDLEAQGSVEALRRHLAVHGIDATAETIAARGRSAGDALADHCREHAAGLLVMGAYGHSRIRDFIMGGATRRLVADTPLPVLLSH